MRIKGVGYLITGGAGFIGSRLADHLLIRGDLVTATDDLSGLRLASVDASATSLTRSEGWFSPQPPDAVGDVFNVGSCTSRTTSV